MTKIFLHVGMPKCASSTLQAFFKENEKQHVEAGFCYPKECREESGYFSHRPLHQAKKEDLRGVVDRIAEEAKEKKCQTIFLSSEEFSNSLWDKNKVGLIVGKLNERFGPENVCILFLLRNHFTFVESVYAQFLKAGMFRVSSEGFFSRLDLDHGVTGFIEYFRELNGFDFFDYSNFIERFRSEAPRNPVEALSIERLDLGEKDIIEKLCDKFSLPKKASKKNINLRFKEKALLAINYARFNYPDEEIKTKRGIFNKVFQGCDEGYSPVLHLAGESFQSVGETAKKDRVYFEKTFGDASESIFFTPQGFPRRFDVKMSLGDGDIEAINYIVKDNSPSIERAKKMLGG